MVDHADVRLDARRHGIVLVPPFLRALAVAAVGGAALLGPRAISPAGAALLVVAAFVALSAVLRWDCMHVVVTSDTLLVVHGVLRRAEVSVRLERLGPVEVGQSLLGRLLGYGTVVAGDLEIRCVAAPRELVGILARPVAHA